MRLLSLLLFACSGGELTVKDHTNTITKTVTVSDTDGDADSDGDSDADGDGDSDSDSDADTDTDADGDTSTATTGDTGPLPLVCEGQVPYVVSMVYDYAASGGQAADLARFEGPGLLCSVSCDQDWVTPGFVPPETACSGAITTYDLAEDEQMVFCVEVRSAPDEESFCTITAPGQEWVIRVWQ